jgi:regulator of replication initiation timing
MKDIKPATGILKLYKEVLIRQAIKEAGNLNKEIEQLRNRLNEIANTRTATNTKYSIDQLSKTDRDDVVAKLDEEKYQIVEELAGLKRQQTVQETAIEYAINFMTNSAKLWEDASLEHRQRFQSLIFKEGLILNTQTFEFGTTKISPLYRYAPNKKDLSVKEKSLLVIPRGVDSPSASPELHDCKHSLHRKVRFRTATGSSHPVPAGNRCSTPYTTKVKTPVLQLRFLLW